MRRLAPLALLALTLMVGCKSPEEKACAHTVELIAKSGITNNKSERDRQSDCLDSLGRLRQQTKPDEEQWYAYLRCLTAAQDMSEQFDCLGPLTGPPVASGPAPADAKQPSR